MPNCMMFSRIEPNCGSSATKLLKALCMLCIGVLIKLIKEPQYISGLIMLVQARLDFVQCNAMYKQPLKIIN